MNPEANPNAAKNSGENGEKKLSDAGIKRLGENTLDLDGYLAEDEKKALAEKEAVEQDQNANRSRIAELKAQMDALVAEQAKLAEEQMRHEQEIQNIISQRAEKAEAMRNGIKGMAEWYDKHPEELEEVIRPEMGHDADYYRNWQQETGQSFAGVVAESVRIGELLQREDLKDITKEELDKEAQALEQKQRDFADYQALIARKNGDMSAKLSDNYFDAKPIEKIAKAEKAEESAEKPAEKEQTPEDFSKSMLGQIDKMMEQPEADLGGMSEEKLQAIIDEQLVKFEEFKKQQEKKSIFQLMEEKGSAGNDIDRAVAEQKFRTREAKIANIEDAYRKKAEKKLNIAGSLRRAAVGVLALLSLGGLATTINGCTKNLSDTPMGATPVESTAVAGAAEQAEEAKEAESAGPEQEQGWMSKSGEEGEQSFDNYIANYYTMDSEGNRIDRSDNLHRKVDFKAENPFDYEVKEKGEKLTADKKETKASFGTTLTPNGLDGDIDAAEKEFNRNLMNRAANQEELAISLLAGIGGSEALKDVDFSTGNDIDEPAKLDIANGKISPEAVNRDSRILAALPEEQQQKIMNALSEGWQKLIDNKEFSLVNWKGAYSSQTMKPAEDGAIAHDIVIQDNVKRSVEFAVYQVNDNATKLTVLQTMGKINPDVTLEQAEAKGLLKNWEVGLKSDCGGQWVAKKKVVKKVVKNTPAPEQVVTPVVTYATETPVITFEQPTTPPPVIETPPPKPPTPPTPPEPEPPKPPTPPTPPGPEPPKPPTPPTPPEPEPPTPPVPPTPPGPEPPAPDPEPTPKPKDPTIDPWGPSNPEPLPVTPEEPTDPEQKEVIQKGEDTPPPQNEEGVNEKPEDQAPWAEEPTAPPEDTNTGGEGEYNPEDKDEAIRRLQQQ